MTTPEKPHLLCLDLKHFVATVTLLIEIGVGVGLWAFGLGGSLCTFWTKVCYVKSLAHMLSKRNRVLGTSKHNYALASKGCSKTPKIGTWKQGSEQSQSDFSKNIPTPECKDTNDSKAIIIITLSEIKPIVFFFMLQRSTKPQWALQMKDNWGFFVKLRASVGPQVSAEQYGGDKKRAKGLNWLLIYSHYTFEPVRV